MTSKLSNVAPCRMLTIQNLVLNQKGVVKNLQNENIFSKYIVARYSFPKIFRKKNR